MRKPTVSPAGFGAAAVLALALAGSASAHSWIERAYKIAPNGTMVGAEGYPRGWIPRNSTDPLWTDSIPQWILPAAGQSAYSGDEVLNKFPKDESPQYPMLEAAAGDHVAIIHLENGHTTLPQNQPKKPKNRGTIYFYGTSQPRDSERLFDVHLVWNRNGTGGDGRGRLLATRNYDDGQCYQPNGGEISAQRAAELAPEGAVHAEELACQSDVRLPDDLQPGSVYTVYWYWDWPDLDAGAMDVDATTDGVFPWAGTFMRGEADPHGFTMAAIAKNESYASAIDIKITGGAAGPAKVQTQAFAAVKGGQGGAANGTTTAAGWVASQNIYSKAIKEQMASNYQVNVDANESSGDSSSSSSPSPSSGSSAEATFQVSSSDAAAATTSVEPSSSPFPSASSSPTTTAPPVAVPTTVTVTVTVPPSTVVQTVYTTVPSESMPSSTSTSAEPPAPLPTQTIVTTLTIHVPAAAAAAAATATTTTQSTGRPAVTPFVQRRDWRFGRY